MNETKPNQTRMPVIASAAILTVAIAAAALVPAAGAQSVAGMQAEIQRTKAKIDAKQGKADDLSVRIGALSSKIHGLQGGITKLRNQEAGVQARLDSAVAELRVVQGEHRKAEARLAKLRGRLSHSRKVLARRLVELYQSDRPDLITVVLKSDGFAQLIENREFLARIGTQDRNIITTVKAERDETQTLTRRLAKIEDRRQQLAASIKADRDQIASVRSGLESRQQAWIDARSARQDALSSIKSDQQELRKHVDALESDVASVTGQLQSAAPLPAGPVRAGSGQFIWPINGTLTSPFCESRAWESCHPGIDIAAPTGTPIRAAGSGTVQLAGWTGGYGNYTCIGHGGGVSTCYGHQSAIHVSVGQRVSQGQVIGLVGSTGHSTGPHLHFEVRVNGSVTNPMNWL